MPRYIISVCCICKKVYNKQPLPEDYGKLGIPEIDNKDPITHGYCLPCSEVENKRIDKLIKDRRK